VTIYRGSEKSDTSSGSAQVSAAAGDTVPPLPSVPSQR